MIDPRCQGASGREHRGSSPLVSASPHPVSNRTFARSFARAVHRPRLGPVPGGCHILFGCVVLTLMRIAVVGGTGTLGRSVATLLRERGHDAVSRARIDVSPLDRPLGADASAKRAPADRRRARRSRRDRPFGGATSRGETHRDRGARAPRAPGLGSSLEGCNPPRSLQLVRVNGAPGILLVDSEGVVNVVAFTLDAGRITAIGVVRNPEKLTSLRDRNEPRDGGTAS
jgi:hypothetical protein